MTFILALVLWWFFVTFPPCCPIFILSAFQLYFEMGWGFCCKHGKLNKWKDLSMGKREETLPRAHTSLSRRGEQTSFTWVSDAGRETLHSIFEIISLFRVTGMKSFILWTDDAPLGIFLLSNLGVVTQNQKKEWVIGFNPDYPSSHAGLFPVFH